MSGKNRLTTKIVRYTYFLGMILGTTHPIVFDRISVYSGGGGVQSTYLRVDLSYNCSTIQKKKIIIIPGVPSFKGVRKRGVLTSGYLPQSTQQAGLVGRSSRSLASCL